MMAPLTFATVGAALAAFAASSPAETSARAAVPVRGPGFALIAGPRGLADIGCAPPAVAQPALLGTVTRALGQLDVDPRIAIVLATGPLVCNDTYYFPVANDVGGIGYAHEAGDELFDHSPESQLEGIVFLNDWPYWQARPAEFQRAFNHELGHRWAARVHARIGGAPSDELLGRQGMHWSYFLETGGSPLEGNRWHAEPLGRYRTEAPQPNDPFSELDLYLMGVLPAEAVQPLRLLRAAPTRALDCASAPLDRSSPPQGCDSIEIEAEVVTVSLDDVIAVEGPRVPPAASEPTRVEIATLVLASAGTSAPGPSFSGADCTQLAEALGQRQSDFAAATRERLQLVNVLAGDESCQAFDAVAPELPRGCSLSAPPRAASASPVEAAFLLGWLGLGRDRRRRVRAQGQASAHPNQFR